ncbi:hypothetical protein ACQKFX_21325 [Cupriavidus metallidurans]|uniref:hypothetical protein n=1 Tax=Cupriavidus metallidurans TaxID=119219 RepID=UPI003D04B038
MSYDPYDDALGDIADQVMKDRSIDGSRYYLGTFGDAVEERINLTLCQSRELLNHGFPSAALVLASTAIELLIRFMLVRPLVQGAFLSDEWADLLANRIGAGRTDEDRKILPLLLKQWDLDINGVLLPGNKRLWDAITKIVLPKRHKIVHTGATASAEEAALALACVDALIAEILHPLAKSLGFTLTTTGKWCQIHGKNEYSNGESSQWWSSFTPQSPFEDA